LDRGVRGNDFYAEEFCQSDACYEWGDVVWKDPPVKNVEVGPIKGVSAVKRK